MLARSKASSCKAVGISYVSGQMLANQSARLLRLEKESPDKCFNAGCDCEIIISDHGATVSGDHLDDYTSTITQ